jgi:excisionase family DNA binding protein
MQKLLCDIPQAGAALGIGRSKVFELVQERTLESVKIGRRRLICVESITAYVNSLKEAA